MLLQYYTNYWYFVDIGKCVHHQERSSRERNSVHSFNGGVGSPALCRSRAFAQHGGVLWWCSIWSKVPLEDVLPVSIIKTFGFALQNQLDSSKECFGGGSGMTSLFLPVRMEQQISNCEHRNIMYVSTSLIHLIATAVQLSISPCMLEQIENSCYAAPPSMVVLLQERPRHYFTSFLTSSCLFNGQNKTAFILFISKEDFRALHC